MKTLGLLGGMSWESTASYYSRLNRLTREARGGKHSAPLVIWSADFDQIAALQSKDDWAGATAVLVDAARRLEQAGADAILICANTMHLMAAEVQAAVAVPLIHIIDETAKVLNAAGRRRPLVLATRFTIEKPFYRKRMSEFGLTPITPPVGDCERLHAIIFDELVQGRIEMDSRRYVGEIARRAVEEQAADSVVLACTEFGLLVDDADFTVPLFDTTDIHVRAGLAFALRSMGT